MYRIDCDENNLFTDYPVLCEDVVTVDLPKAIEQIVIDAELGRPQGGGMATLRVLVTKTTDFYNSEILSVEMPLYPTI